CESRTASAALLFAGVRAQAAGVRESRPEGSTFFLQCPYTERDSYRTPKALCQMTKKECSIVAQTYYPYLDAYVNQPTGSKVTVRDNIKNETILITMSNLQVQDSGTYSCAYRQSPYIYVPLKTISLHVFKEIHMQELGWFTVQCPYSTQLSSRTKAWCRQEGNTSCNILVSVNDSSTEGYSNAPQHRTAMWDNRWDTVTITMEKLQEQDSGVYWCVLDGRTQALEVRLTVSKSEYLCRTAWLPQLPAPLSCLCFPPSLPRSAGSPELLPGRPAAKKAAALRCLQPLRELTTCSCFQARSSIQPLSNRQAQDIYDKPEDTEQFQTTEQMESPRKDSKELKYVTLNFTGRCSPGEPLYVNVGLEQAASDSKAESVEYTNVALK
ncbi:PIGR protein, partial [Crypturellus undulatus]|nr:PIGR protein [Crypturellus undulatus]